MLTVHDKIQEFMSSPEFAVVGASCDPKSWSHRLLLWYEGRKLTVYPINPNHVEVGGETCLKCIADLPSPTKTALSIATQPNVTLTILQQAQQANVPIMWIQPGAEDAAVLDFISKQGLEDNVIHSTQQTSSHPPSLRIDTTAFSQPESGEESDTKTGHCGEIAEAFTGLINRTAEPNVVPAFTTSTVQQTTTSAGTKGLMAEVENIEQGSRNPVTTNNGIKPRDDNDPCVFRSADEVLKEIKNIGV